MTFVLPAVFFLSGAAGLLFETLWFRVLGLSLGNSFWASSIVLASFMAGLALGSALSARYGRRIRRPLRCYAIVEAVVGLMGAGIVVLLPVVSPGLARAFAHGAAHPWLVNGLRLVVAFSSLVVPATAMGLTLPLIAQAATARDVNFGRVLGRLYGWNTIGGMVGVLSGELWLIGWLGLRGTAYAAGALNLTAAAAAMYLSRQTGESPAAASVSIGAPIETARSGGRSSRILVAAFAAGAALLALEVTWFRFLQLFVYGTGLIFAAMLAVVLLGIGAGSVAAGLWLSRDEEAHRFSALVALALGISVEVSYAAFNPRIGSLVYTTANTVGAVSLFIRLMLPASLLSGALFALLGAAQRHECGDAAETAGKLTLANTAGAAIGSLTAGFVLLPRLGMERTFFAAMASYGLLACFCVAALTGAQRARYSRRLLIPAFALFALAGALYPFGLMKRHFIPLVMERYQASNPQLIAAREGLTETVMYLRNDFQDQPLYHRLMTNGHSMSATTFRGRRYMKLYVYWALATNPTARKALLISYGIGNTAKALSDAKQLESIDVVDISRDVLELGGLAFPGQAPPLADPRVRVHVEDGRFFLQATEEKFDLITAEPPPPRGAGVTNLYSREYFELLRDRLRDGGVVTYWLPVSELWPSETRAIMRAFCDAFPSCSLWSGAGTQWMLAGVQGARGPAPEGQFTAQWQDPVVGPEMASLGFEQPESLGATFLADAARLDDWIDGAAPLDDDHPGRILASYPPDEDGDPIYLSWMEPTAARLRFESSPLVEGLWPPDLRRRTAASFGPQGVLDDVLAWGRLDPIVELYQVLTHTSQRTLPLLLIGTEPAVQRIGLKLYESGQRNADLEFELGARDMSEKNYEGASQHLARVTEGRNVIRATLVRTLALGLLGRTTDGREALNALGGQSLSPVDAHAARWLAGFLDHRARLANPPARAP